MQSIVNVEWVRMFAADELSVLVSGTSSVDIEDLRRNTVYAGGYSATHECVRVRVVLCLPTRLSVWQWFWEVVSEFDEQQRADLLKFATSCSRAPLLGFQALEPKFCIHRRAGHADGESLPTAATCMNLLRLPRYLSKDQLRQKLLYAAQSCSGFQLT